MSITAIALVLAASFLHALWNARTHAGDDRRATLAASYLFGALLLSPWLLTNPPTEVWPLVLLSGTIHGGYLWALSGAYDRGQLATTYPIARGSAPILVAIVAVWFLDQTPSAATLGGAAAVAVGLALIGNVAWGVGERMSIAMALATGCFIASYTLVDARGASEVNAWGFFSGSSLVAVCVVSALGAVSPTRLRRSARAGAIVGAASASGYALILLAYTRADAANVATLRSTSILFGLALVPRTLTRKLITGAVLAVAGSVLVAL